MFAFKLLSFREASYLSKTKNSGDNHIDEQFRLVGVW